MTRILPDQTSDIGESMSWTVSGMTIQLYRIGTSCEVGFSGTTTAAIPAGTNLAVDQTLGSFAIRNATGAGHMLVFNGNALLCRLTNFNNQGSIPSGATVRGGGVYQCVGA